MLAQGVWITDHAFYRGEVRGSLPLLLFNFPSYAESAQLEGCPRVAQAKRITRIGSNPPFPPPASLHCYRLQPNTSTLYAIIVTSNQIPISCFSSYLVRSKIPWRFTRANTNATWEEHGLCVVQYKSR
jgi:hypothetical protein